MNKRDVLLNELAQGLRPISEGIEWFDGRGQEEQFQVLLFLRHHCVQARAITEDAPESIRRSGLRPTHTPAVLISRGRIDEQLGKIAGLAPLDERRKAFRLLIAVLAIADGRRRERFCSGGCSPLVAPTVRRLTAQHRTLKATSQSNVFQVADQSHQKSQWRAPVIRSAYAASV
ncbi:DUF5958 family protein [Streptomyces sp. H49]|uniref:DUF5958 family protein n=1 Tax=Streptomyces sp. H49 TaxID=3444117 RepID=UPI003F4AF7B3